MGEVIFRKQGDRKIKYFFYGMLEGIKFIRLVTGMKGSKVFKDFRFCYLFFFWVLFFMFYIKIIKVKY